LVSTRPDLVRSWVSDAPGIGDADFEIFAVPKEHALTLAEGIERTMGDCILALYRSAVDVGREWAPDLRDVPAPGLVLVPSEDPVLSADRARTTASRAGADVAGLDGLGHWWKLQDPERGADVLEEFWSSLG
jgi:hypothetical protein